MLSAAEADSTRLVGIFVISSRGIAAVTGSAGCEALLRSHAILHGCLCPRTYSAPWNYRPRRRLAGAGYLVSLFGEAVNSFGFATGRDVRLTKLGAPAAAP